MLKASPRTPFTYRDAIEQWCFLMCAPLTLTQLIAAAHERGLLFFTIPRRGSWETLDHANLLPPIGYLVGEGFSPGMEFDLLQRGELRLREETGYAPWTADTEPLYSFWQIITLGEISDALAPSHPVDRLEQGLDGYARFLRAMADNFDGGEPFANNRAYWRWRELILTRTQTLLLPRITGRYPASIYIPGLGEDAFAWSRRQRREFDYFRAARSCGVTADSLAGLYDGLVTDGSRLDPMANWFDLADQIKRDQKERLKGTSRRALDYYLAARVIRGWHSHISDTALPDINEQIHGDAEGVRSANLRLFGHEEVRANRAALPGVLEHFGIYPWRVQLIVEGQSDAVLIETLLKKLYGWSFAQAGIHTVSLEGAGIPKKLELVLGQVRAYANYYLLVFDNEHNIQKVIDALRRAGHIEAQPETHIWAQDIEADSFSTKEICFEIRAAARAARVERFRLTTREVERRMAKSSRGVATIALEVAEANGFRYNKRDLAERLANRAANEVRSGAQKCERPIIELVGRLLRLSRADRRLRGRLRK